MKTIKGLFKLINWGGSWKWWVGGLLIFLALIGGLKLQHDKIQTQRAALVTASEQLKVAATQIRARDNLIFSVAKTDGQAWTTAEEKCLAQITAAYDAGRNIAGSGGVQRSIRERQAAGAFSGSVSRPGSDGGGR